MKVSNIHEFAHQESGGGRGGELKYQKTVLFMTSGRRKKGKIHSWYQDI